MIFPQNDVILSKEGQTKYHPTNLLIQMLYYKLTRLLNLTFDNFGIGTRIFCIISSCVEIFCVHAI